MNILKRIYQSVKYSAFLRGAASILDIGGVNYRRYKPRSINEALAHDWKMLRRDMAYSWKDFQETERKRHHRLNDRL